MPLKFDFTPEEIKRYVTGQRKHYYWERCDKVARDLAYHALGSYPSHLIDERRPNEPVEVKDYRKKIFQPKTKPYFAKIESTLQKIRRSSDWSIRYPKDKEFSRIPEGEQLQDYCEDNFPGFGSVTNWAFASLLRQYLIDPNGVVVMMPLSEPDDQTKYYEPRPFIFTSEHVLDYKKDDYAFIEDAAGTWYVSGKELKKGRSFWGVTTSDIIRYDQVNGKNVITESYRFQHGFDQLPVIHMGGVIVESYGPWIYRESRIAGIVPEFNEALREYSDLQASKVMHLFPERWEYTNNECTACKGGGLVPGVTDGVPCDVTCNTCAGRGYVVAGPYSKIVVKPPSTATGDSPNIPLPPAGFVEKDVEIIKVQEQSIADHIYNGLAAINFEFIAKAPLTQSGIAKEVDKDDLNNTVHSIAEDIVAIMDGVYYWAAKWRYSTQYPNDQDIFDMVPKVAVPEKYDIYTSTMYQEQFKTAKEAKMNPAILNTLEVEYANKAFNNDPGVRDRVALILVLDPLANVTEDDKMSRLSNNGISQESYVISSNINEFVERAVDENQGFAEMELKKQKEIMSKYAGELIAAMEPKVEPDDLEGDEGTDEPDPDDPNAE